MGILKILGLFAIIPTTILLTISFFVLFAVRKIEGRGLKVFGYCLAVLLWIGAALIFSVGLYSISTGRHMMMCPMQEMMKQKMQNRMQGEQMPSMMHEHK